MNSLLHNFYNVQSTAPGTKGYIIRHALYPHLKKSNQRSEFTKQSYSSHRRHIMSVNEELLYIALYARGGRPKMPGLEDT